MSFELRRRSFAAAETDEAEALLRPLKHARQAVALARRGRRLPIAALRTWRLEPLAWLRHARASRGGSTRSRSARWRTSRLTARLHVGRLVLRQFNCWAMTRGLTGR